MEKSKFLEVAIQAVKNAESIIMEYYSGAVAWQQKSDLSPVTIADTEAERIIIETIKQAFPDHGFMGEESGESTTGSEYTWIIDPIDGTRNYVRRIPLFATQLALMYKGEIIVGVSNAPAMAELLFAEKGEGAFLQDRKISVSDIKNISDAYLSFGGLKHFKQSGYLDNLLKLSESADGHRGFGDAWMFHLLAQGKIDIIVEAKVKIWDIAALKIIIEEAGGKVTDIKGNPITKNSTSIVATNKYLHDAVLEVFRS